MDDKFATVVTDWVIQQAEAMGVSMETHSGGVSQEGDWLSVPVAVRQGGDAYERATLLQQIEDAWDLNAHHGLKLLLVPAGAKDQTPSRDSERVGELMTRQHQLLDRMGEKEFPPEDRERFQAVRQEWEETLREMEQLYPRLKAGTVSRGRSHTALSAKKGRREIISRRPFL